MPKKSCTTKLTTVIGKWLPRLRALSLVISTYGSPEDAEELNEFICQLEREGPANCFEDVQALDFVVNATFKVSRNQVAATLFHAFSSETAWCRVTKLREPPKFRFRTLEQTVVRLVDYPLNEGGFLNIVTSEHGPRVFRLDLNAIARGLDALAQHYPRHFADLINENGDALTADVLLQCCLFGKLVYG